MSGRAFGIVNFSSNQIYVQGLQDYRPIGAFSFLGRYRIIDFPISNMSNSDIDHIQVYLNRKPRSLTEHIGTGRHYNINSKNGKIRLLYSEDGLDNTNIYNTDIAAFIENMECIERERFPYVVIAPSYVVYAQDFNQLIDQHISSDADITMLYHSVDCADRGFLNCNTLTLNRQKGVLSIERNRGTMKTRHISLDTYVMRKDLFVELIEKAHKTSSMYNLSDIINATCAEYDVRAVAHRGFFAPIADLKSYYDANIELIDFKTSETLFDDEWPMYTRTSDSAPTKYFETGSVVDSVVSNGCIIEGSIKHSVIGRGCVISKGAVIEDSILLPQTVIGENVHIKNYIVDKGARLEHENELTATSENPGYVKRGDLL